MEDPFGLEDADEVLIEDFNLGRSSLRTATLS